jgi:hypothetical protein
MSASISSIDDIVTIKTLAFCYCYIKLILHRHYKSWLHIGGHRVPTQGACWLDGGDGRRLGAWTTDKYLGGIAVKRADVEREFGGRLGGRNGIQRHFMI